jgi:hypothetical protein
MSNCRIIKESSGKLKKCYDSANKYLFEHKVVLFHPRQFVFHVLYQRSGPFSGSLIDSFCGVHMKILPSEKGQQTIKNIVL